MRLILISDTHSLHNRLWNHPKNYIDPTQTNILIHAGDCTNVGKDNEITDFVYWFQNLEGFDNKIFIAGNHDFGFEKFPRPDWLTHLINDENLSQSDCVYLQDSSFTIESDEFSRPLKFYGSPWQPEFYNWAFNLPRNGEELERRWNMIPDDTDILITHGPPFGILDLAPRGGNVGCELLIKRANHISPLIHVFGHIHYSYGFNKSGDTFFVNASICDERYNPINNPIVIELTEVDGKIIADFSE